MGKTEIDAFLSHLAVNRNVSASTQRQALNAIVFLYRKVIDLQLEFEIEPVKARNHRSPPVVLTQNEVQQVMHQMTGVHLTMVKRHYGGGLRLMECIRLRIKDLVLTGQTYRSEGVKAAKTA